MQNDLRLAIRTLFKARGFSAAAIITLAIGIAANSTVFSLVNGVLLRALPFDQPDRLVEFGTTSYLDLQDLRASARSFEGIAAVDERTMNVADEGRTADRFLGAYISWDGFDLVGRTPMLGRSFAAADERSGALPTVVLGHAIWQNRYSSDPAIIGRSIRVNGTFATVIGVMPPGFAFPQTAQLWQPLSLNRPDLLADRNLLALDVFGRLRPGVTIDQAREEIGAIAGQLARSYPSPDRDQPVQMGVFRSGVGTDTALSQVFMFMLGAVGFVLLIACANVANLALVRSASRTHEISVRLSLGASRWQIVRQLLAESTVLAVIAGIAALGLSRAAVTMLWRAVQATGDTPPYWLTFDMDVRVFWYLAAMSLGTVFLSGLAPAWLTSRSALATMLSSGRGQTGGRRSRRLTGSFVIAQLALTVVLLSGSALMIRSLLAQVTVDAGIDTTTLLRLRLDPPPGSDPEQAQAVFSQIEDRVARMPSVRLTYANTIPLGGAPERAVVTDRVPDLPAAQRPLAGQMIVGIHYFETVGVSLRRGRSFQSRDIQDGGVAIVNERFAALHFPGIDPIGRRVRLFPVRGPATPANSTDWLTVVGVAGNIRQESLEGGAFDPLVYLPVGTVPLLGANLLVRSPLETAAVVSLVREEMRAIDPDLPLFDIRTVDQQAAFNRWPQRVFGSMFVVFAGIALLLGTVGLYAVTAYAASQRTREIGLRVALGATAGHIGWLVTCTAAVRLGIGLALGMAGGVAIARILPAQLVGTSSNDARTFVTVATVLVTAGLLACLMPARRAMRVDPAVTLRAE